MRFLGIKLFNSGLIVLSCLYSSFAQDLQKNDSWRSIKPLTSTLQQVESLLGPPAKNDGNQRYYDTSSGDRITVWYSGAPDNSSCKWRVPDGVVVRVIVSPRKRLLLSQAGFDLNTFKTERTLDDGVWNYIEKDKGILINTRDLPDNSDKIVVFMELYPTAKEKCLSTSP